MPSTPTTRLNSEVQQAGKLVEWLKALYNYTLHSKPRPETHSRCKSSISSLKFVMESYGMRRNVVYIIREIDLYLCFLVQHNRMLLKTL